MEQENDQRSDTLLMRSTRPKAFKASFLSGKLRRKLRCPIFDAFSSIPPTKTVYVQTAFSKDLLWITMHTCLVRVVGNESALREKSGRTTKFLIGLIYFKYIV